MEKKKKEIKKEKALIILILIIIISSLITYFIYNSLKPIEIQTIDMSLTVGDYTGFDVNTSSLIFGTAAPSSFIKRSVNITNIDENTHEIHIKATGDLKKWISISETEFILKKEESKEISIKANIPNDAEYREYEGKLKIIFR